MEATARFYIGNSFSIPLAYAYYKISYPDWVYSGVTYDIDYEITQLNYGIGNEWTYDWGAYLGIDWYQINGKMSIKGVESDVKLFATGIRNLNETTTTSLVLEGQMNLFDWGIDYDMIVNGKSEKITTKWMHLNLKINELNRFSNSF